MKDDLLFSYLFPTAKVNKDPVEYPLYTWTQETKTPVTTKKWNTKAREDRFPKEGGKPIKASVPGYAKIPWFKSTLTLIGLKANGKVRYAKTEAEKKNFAFDSFDTILVCWPGIYTQDIFVIDGMDAFRKALGFKKVGEPDPNVRVDENGEEWVSGKPL